MDRTPVIQSYREEANKLRWELNQLTVNSVEERASDEVRKWRQNFDTTSSQIERVINEMEKRKQSEVSQLANELRISLDQFKEKNLNRLMELDTFISRINFGDDIQLDYVKFELDTITKKINSLHFDIIVKVVDTSRRRDSTTVLTRNTLELVKVFEDNRSRVGSTRSGSTRSGSTRSGSTRSDSTSPDSASSSCRCLERALNFVRRKSSAGAGYYNIGVLGHRKYS